MDMESDPRPARAPRIHVRRIALRSWTRATPPPDAMHATSSARWRRSAPRGLWEGAVLLRAGSDPPSTRRPLRPEDPLRALLARPGLRVRLPRAAPCVRGDPPPYVWSTRAAFRRPRGS